MKVTARLLPGTGPIKIGTIVQKANDRDIFNWRVIELVEENSAGRLWILEDGSKYYEDNLVVKRLHAVRYDTEVPEEVKWDVVAEFLVDTPVSMEGWTTLTYLGEKYYKYENDKWFKIIGPISLQALWVIDRDIVKIIMKEPRISGVQLCLYPIKKDGSITGFSNSPKTIQEALEANWIIAVLGPCGHYH